jgi:hypothetical protein
MNVSTNAKSKVCCWIYPSFLQIVSISPFVHLVIDVIKKDIVLMEEECKEFDRIKAEGSPVLDHPSPDWSDF